jgi:hypothetical protein
LRGGKGLFLRCWKLLSTRPDEEVDEDVIGLRLIHFVRLSILLVDGQVFI